MGNQLTVLQSEAMRNLEQAKLTGSALEPDFMVAIRACARNRDLKSAMGIFADLETLKQPSGRAYTYLLSAFERRKDLRRGLQLVETVRTKGIIVNDVFYTIAISLCAKVHALSCFQIFKQFHLIDSKTLTGNSPLSRNVE